MIILVNDDLGVQGTNYGSQPIQFVTIRNKSNKKSLINLNNEGGCEGSTFT